MKKKIFCSVVVIFLLATSLLVYFQWSNIRGVIYFLKYSDKEIENMIKETDGSLKQTLEDYIGQPIREFTEEENEQIAKGEVTEEEVLDKIVYEQLQNKSDNSKKEDKTAWTSKYITRLYNLKGYYLAELDKMVASAVADYKALEKSQRTRSKKLEIGASYASKAMSLEAECDKKVAAIVSELSSELKAKGEKTSIINDINNAYKKEKSLKRAYYLNMFK